MSLHSAVAEAVREGKEIASGKATLTASTVITTPFATIDSVSIVRETGTAPGLTTSVYTYTVNGNQVTIFAWKPTAAADATLIAATASSTVSFTIIGRRRK